MHIRKYLRDNEQTLRKSSVKKRKAAWTSRSALASSWNLEPRGLLPRGLGCGSWNKGVSRQTRLRESGGAGSPSFPTAAGSAGVQRPGHTYPTTSSGKLAQQKFSVM